MQAGKTDINSGYEFLVGRIQVCKTQWDLKEQISLSLAFFLLSISLRCLLECSIYICVMSLRIFYNFLCGFRCIQIVFLFICSINIIIKKLGQRQSDILHKYSKKRQFFKQNTFSFKCYNILMTTQFYKFATSLNEKLLSHSQCYVKIHKSIRKFRKIYLSNIYIYVMSEQKIKYKISCLKIHKIYTSNTSAEFVLFCDSRSVLIDSLIMREAFKKQLLVLNPDIEIVSVQEPLLDSYVEGSKQLEKEAVQVFNLNRMRGMFQEFNEHVIQKRFTQIYRSIDLIAKEEYYTLMTVQQKGDKKILGKKKKKSEKQEKEIFTVKVYSKKLIGQNKILLDLILRQRKCLQDILSPYIPILYKCMFSKSHIYCIMEYYKAEKLKFYLSNESLSKTQFKNVVAQIVMALGQIHQCNFVYNCVDFNGIMVTDSGFVLLNQFSNCSQIKTNVQDEDKKHICKDSRPPEAKDNPKMTACWDWWSMGNLIFMMKEGRNWKQGDNFPWSKQPQLCKLAQALLELQPQKRLGWRNDYHEILAHEYFKDVNKKQMATQKCDPLKKFFNINQGKINFQSDGEDWSIHDSYLKNYQFSRQLE